MTAPSDKTIELARAWRAADAAVADTEDEVARLRKDADSRCKAAQQVFAEHLAELGLGDEDEDNPAGLAIDGYFYAIMRRSPDSEDEAATYYIEDFRILNPPTE